MENLAREKCAEAIENANYQEAMLSARERLKLSEQLNDNFKIADSYAQLGEIETALKNADEADSYYLKAAACMDEFFSRNQIDETEPKEISRNHDDAAIHYLRAKNFEKAIEHCQTEINILKEEFGEQNGYLITAYRTFCMIYDEMNEHKKAVEICKESAEISEIFYGKEHDEILTCYSALYVQYVKLYMKTHDMELLEKAEELISFIIETNEKTDNADSLENIRLYMEYSDLLRLLDKEELCLEYMKKAFDGYKDYFEENDSAWIDILCRASDSYVHFNYMDKGRELVEKVIVVCKVNSETESSEYLQKYLDSGMKEI